MPLAHPEPAVTASGSSPVVRKDDDSQRSFLPSAGRVSVTIVHDATKSFGLRLAKHPNEDGGSSSVFVIDMIATHHRDGMFRGSPLREGDVLKTINNQTPETFLREDSISSSSSGGNTGNEKHPEYEYLRGGSFRDGEPVTFVVERCPVADGRNLPQEEEEDEDQGATCAIVQAFGRRSLEHQVSVPVGVEFHRVVIGEESEHDPKRNRHDGTEETVDSDDDDDEDDDDDSVPPPNLSSSPSASSFLQIDRIDPHGMFAHSVLNQGDIVLAINGYSVCADEDTTVQEAHELLGLPPSPSHAGATNTTGVSVYETVDIVALNPRKLLEAKQRRHRHQTAIPWYRSHPGDSLKRSAKKAGVALGGGAMIGVGLVVHPFGTLLLPLGLSVLGKEFEAPNAVVRKTRDSLQQWAGDGGAKTNKERANHHETSANNHNRASKNVAGSHHSIPPPVGAATPPPRQSGIQTRVKGFGRKYVLPFLDRMAGDRRTTVASASSFDAQETKDAYHSPYPEASCNEYHNGTKDDLQGRDDDYNYETTISFTSSSDLGLRATSAL